ncbi:GTP-binding protein Rho1 [Coemansia sp. RSA 2673]|nr:GTP-binding protein Rho1 [Coemansia sp. RSA 2673]
MAGLAPADGGGYITRRKAVVIGDGACGKTCLLHVFRVGRFPTDNRYIPTVFDVCIKDVEHRGHSVEVELWDTAGQEDYDRLRPLSYPEASVVVVCFAVDDVESLGNVVEKWVPEAQEHAPRARIVLAALKTDLRTDPQTVEHMRRIHGRQPLDFEDGSRLARSLDVPYVECSAKLNVNVRHVFETSIALVVSDKDFDEPTPHCCLIL